jgi:hypothetical protein
MRQLSAATGPVNHSTTVALETKKALGALAPRAVRAEVIGASALIVSFLSSRVVRRPEDDLLVRRVHLLSDLQDRLACSSAVWP